METSFDKSEEEFYNNERMSSDSISNLDNSKMMDSSVAPTEGECDMIIKRQVTINGTRKWITAYSEQEYADRIIQIANENRIDIENAGKHNLRAYAKNWFIVFSKPNVETATAITYQRQMNRYIFPAIGDMFIEDITPSDVQKMFNAMDVAKPSKDKVHMVLNMIFDMAIDDGIIIRNPAKSRKIRISGKSCKHTEEYSLEQMRYLIRHMPDIENDTDRVYMALQALHPLRLEEVLGLKWADIDRGNMLIHIRRAVTHPTRNQPEIKDPKTQSSVRSIGLSRLALDCINFEGNPEDFVIGGESPYSYTQVRRMCERIRKKVGFDDRITPIRFRTTVLTDIYDQTKDIKQAQTAAGHSTAAMTLKYYVKGRSGAYDAANAIERAYGGVVNA